MALDAKIRGSWKWHQIPISRSMSSMATQALHRNVFVSSIDHLFSHGVVRMFRPVMAVLAKFGDGGLLQKKGGVRGMRSMTAFAVSFLDWIMRQRSFDHSPLCGSIFLLLFFGELFLRRHGVNMTLPTQSLHIPRQKLFLRRGMGFMAVQTAHLVNERPMDPVFIKRVIHHGAVAPPAQLKPSLLRLQRIRRSRGFMALCARLIGNRSMHIIE